MRTNELLCVLTYYCAYYVPRQATHSSFGFPPQGATRKTKEPQNEQVVCCYCKYVPVHTRHLLYVRTEYRVVDRAVFHGTRIGFFFVFSCSPDGGCRTLLFLVRATATDDVACRRNKEVSDPTVALRPRAFICGRVYHAFGYVLFGTYDNTNIVPGTRKYLITSFRYTSCKAKMVAAAVVLIVLVLSLIREQWL